MTESGKTHEDYIGRIGGTAATARGFMERRWNRYYFRTLKRTVRDMLADEIGTDATVLDIGTSHGNWLPFLRQLGFHTVVGVELDAERAEQARRAGYDEIYNCDARGVPRPSDSIDVAVSNDVFVHILRLQDKAAIVRETERLLRPGGVMVLNHSSARAFGHHAAHIRDHCSYLTLDEFIRLVRDNSSFVIEDIKPSYYSVLGHPQRRTLRHLLMAMPFGWMATSLLDHGVRQHQPIDLSDYVYLKVRKPGG
jgi:SAM-dependent methyltransferase